MSETKQLQYGYEDDGPNCLIGSHGILFARVVDGPRHNAVEYARKFAACDDLIAACKAVSEAFDTLPNECMHGADCAKCKAVAKARSALKKALRE